MQRNALYFRPAAFPYAYFFISLCHKEPSLAPSHLLCAPCTQMREGRVWYVNVLTIAQILGWNVKEVRSERHFTHLPKLMDVAAWKV